MRKKLFVIFLSIMGLVMFSGQEKVLSESGEELKLYIGKAQVIPVSNPTRIAIGNPDVADVVMVSKREITIAPKSVGTTTLVFWDNFGEQSFLIKVFTEDTSEIKRRIDNVLKKLDFAGVKTQAEDEEGKVFLLGEVKTAADKEKMKLAMGTLAEKTVDLINVKEDQTIIEIDVQVLELASGYSSTVGFTWPDSINLTEVGSKVISPGDAWKGLFRMFHVTRDAFTLQIDTLIQEGKARILSRPRLSCLSGKEAKLLVGGEVPVLSSTMSYGGSSGTGPAATPGNVEYKEYGIKLNIKPQATDDGRIHLNVDIEVSEVDTAGLITTDYAAAYPFFKRNATTELYLDDGATFALGGLIKKKTDEEIRKFPWLADVPILGSFFRSRSITKGDGFDTKGDSELFITITPHIVNPNVPPKDTKELSAKFVPPPKEVDSADPVIKYSKIVQKAVLEKLAYPLSARKAGFQGTTLLGLRISYQGELLEAKVKSSSGYKILDDNALNTASGISTYPPFPSAIDEKELWLEIPVVYQLN